MNQTWKKTPHVFINITLDCSYMDQRQGRDNTRGGREKDAGPVAQSCRFWSLSCPDLSFLLSAPVSSPGKCGWWSSSCISEKQVVKQMDEKTCCKLSQGVNLVKFKTQTEYEFWIAHQNGKEKDCFHWKSSSHRFFPFFSSRTPFPTRRANFPLKEVRPWNSEQMCCESSMSRHSCLTARNLRAQQKNGLRQRWGLLRAELVRLEPSEQPVIHSQLSC